MLKRSATLLKIFYRVLTHFWYYLCILIKWIFAIFEIIFLIVTPLVKNLNRKNIEPSAKMVIKPHKGKYLMILIVILYNIIVFQVYQTVSLEKKQILESWFATNKENPYASKNELEDLQALTSLDGRVIKRWLDNRRCKLRKTGEIKLKCSNFEKEAQLYLSNYFHRKTQSPDKNQIESISIELKCGTKKVEKWFIQRRRSMKDPHMKNCPMHA
jgi:hypothetical protein